MTNTRETPAAPKSTGRKAAADAERTTVTQPDATPTTTVVEKRSGIGPGILIGAIGAALVGGLLIGGGTGALITRTIDLGDRLGIGQLQQQGQNGPLGGGMPGQQQGGGPHQGGQGGPQGGQPGGPPQGQDQDDSTDDSTDDEGTDTEN